MSEAIKLGTIPWQPTPLGGYSRMLRDVPELRLVNLLVKAGEEVLSHLAPAEVVFVVREGTGTVVVEGENNIIMKDTYLVCPAGKQRSILADQGEDLNILVIRCPNL